MRELSTYAPDVESLVIAISRSPPTDAVSVLGWDIIAPLPRLHTLLLSDASRKRRDKNTASQFARDLAPQREWLAEFDRHSTALRRVAFTIELDWEKNGDGVWYSSALPSDKPVAPEPGWDNERNTGGIAAMMQEYAHRDYDLGHVFGS